MLLTVDTPDSASYSILDAQDQLVPYVTSFNTENKEISLFIRTGSSEDGQPIFLMEKFVDEEGMQVKKPVILTFTLTGAYVKKDGEIVN